MIARGWRCALALPLAALVSCAGPQPADTTTSAAQGGAQELRELLAGMGVTYLPAQRRLEIAGKINMEKGLIEVFACAPGGKTHEALVVLDCVPSGVHAGLLALGLEPGTPVETGTEADYKPPRGAPVIVEIAWTAAGGEERRRRAEDLIWEPARSATMPHVAWLFTGSLMQSVTGNPGDATYAADFVKSIITTYHDPSSVLENPLPEGRDDTLYFVREQETPPAGTPVRVTLRPAGPGE